MGYSAIIAKNGRDAGQRSRLPAHVARLRLYALLLCSDIAALIVAFVGPSAFNHGNSNWYAILAVTIPLFAITAFNIGAYSLAALESSRDGTKNALASLLITLGVLLLISYFFRIEQRLPRLALLAAMAGAACCLVLFRGVMAHFLIRPAQASFRAEMLLCDGVDPDDVPRGMRVVHASAFDLVPDLRNPAMLDRFASMIRGVNRVVIACPPEARSRWAMMLKGANVDGEVLANDFDPIGAIGIGAAGVHTTVKVSVGPLTLRRRVAKRCFDLGLSIPLLFAIAPLLVVIAIAIKLDSPGPVLFRQRRVGRGNAFFNILKFRSMRVDLTDKDGKVSATRDDHRITRVGRFIRRTSLDELPQLFNVVLGSMSVVGPRPHALGSTAGKELFWEVDERYWHRHALKPGITGLAQVRGFRGATHHRDDLTHRLQADLEYVAKWSIWSDLTILLSTFKIAIHHNAY